MDALTAVIHEPGSMYFDARRQRLVRVPLTHHGIRCQTCHWSVHIPTSHGRERAEQLRRDHLTSVHFSGLLSGRVVLTPVPDSLAEVASSHPRRGLASCVAVGDEIPGCELGASESETDQKTAARGSRARARARARAAPSPTVAAPRKRPRTPARSG